MKTSLSVALLAATMFVAAPAIQSLSPLSLGDDQAFAAGNGNGGGNGGGHGNAGGSGNGGNRGNSADHAHGNNGKSSAGSTKSNASGKKPGSSSAAVVPPKKSAKPTVVATSAKPNAPAPKPKNIHAQLKGLNSLKRNINGMMNSADPRMAQLRAYITANGDVKATGAALAAAEQNVTDTQKALDDLNAQRTALLAESPPPADLDAQLAVLDAKIADATKARDDAVTAKQAALDAYNAAVTAQASAPTLEDALKAAESPNTTLDANALGWATGEVNRLVDDYAAAKL